jgi:hypothetical protein
MKSGPRAGARRGGRSQHQEGIMWTVKVLRAPYKGARPELAEVKGLPAYETKAMAEKVCELRRKKVGWSFWSAPWLVFPC